MSLLRLALLAVSLAVLALFPLHPSPAAADELLYVTSEVSYNINPDVGPIHVSWQVRLENRDPQTQERESGTIFFYDSLTLPVLRGAAGVTARAGSGSALSVSLDSGDDGPLITASVSFDDRLFFGDTYAFTLEYVIPAAREEALLVTPYYIFLPAISAGDASTVTISTPADQTWEVTLEPADCQGDGPVFTCQSTDTETNVHLAAFAEVIRPDATATIPFSLNLGGREIAVTITYFQGEEAWASHLQELTQAALPVMEGLYGLAYQGPGAINIAERGRQVILGYEGVTSCDPAVSCEIAVSPVADDSTALHELAHLWSDIYDSRWLAEGFAEFIALRTADELGPGLVRQSFGQRLRSSLDLRLDEWGDITYLIAATPEQQEREEAGYDRSLRFLQLLEDQLGLEALQKAGAALAASGRPGDSGRFMDALEDASGQSMDGLFLEWVFPDSFAPILEQRRLARDRLATLIAAASAEGLDAGVPESIRAQVSDWLFDEALAALDDAEAGLQVYLEIKGRLAALRESAAAAGLHYPRSFEQLAAAWRFAEIGDALDNADTALAAYSAARERLAEPRNLWERFGLLGRDPDDTLGEARSAYAAGRFVESITKTDDAVDAVENAGTAALMRLVALLAISVAFTSGGAIIWRRRRPRALL